MIALLIFSGFISYAGFRSISLAQEATSSKLSDLNTSVLTAKNIRFGDSPGFPASPLERIQKEAEDLSRIVVNTTNVNVNLAAGSTLISFVITVLSFLQTYQGYQSERSRSKE